MQNITFTTNVGKNTLEHLKLLLKSLQTNLDNKEHEILIFIDADNENMLEWLLSVKDQFHDLKIIKNEKPIPVGYAVNKTILTEYAKYDIVSYLQSDMVIGPHYDTEILKCVKPKRILSSTRVEPPLHGLSDVTITEDFGLYPETFDLNKWNSFSNTVKSERLINYFFAPITYYKQDWLDLGGYDTIFRRSREDSDLVQRCLHSGIELVQTFSANVYHFSCVSSRGKDWFNKQNKNAQDRVSMQNLADQIELRRFIRKWGSFNHGQSALKKYDIDLVIQNYNLRDIYNIEPFFERIWLTNKNDADILLDMYHHDYDISNDLYGFTPQLWNDHKDMYRLDRLDEKIRVGTPQNYNILMTIDFSKINRENQLINNFSHLYDILSQCDEGIYEFENIIINIKKLSTISAQIKISNPKIEKNTLKIYK